MRKYIKIIFGSLCLATIVFAPVGIIIASKANGSQKGLSIVGQGSSSVKPIIDAITKDTYYNVQYLASGSGKGFESQISSLPLTAFGMTSSLKHPQSNNPSQAKFWTKNNIRTTTFAIDAIAIVLNLPDSIQYPQNERPIIDIKELSKLYDDDLQTTSTWKKLLTNAPGLSPDLNKSPVPYGRDGGKAASGTSDGFWHTLSKNMAINSKADPNHEKLKPKQRTPEANSQALKIVQGHKNSLTYISLGYAMLNETSNSVVATITNTGGKNWVPSIENVKNNSYKWTRPFNIIYSVDDHSALNFTNFLFSPTTQKLIEKNNFISLNTKQIQDQIPFDASDIDRKADLNKGKNMGLSI